jgi:hypothetical protein
VTTEAQTTASRCWIEDGILKSEVLRPVSLTSQQVIESIDVMWETTGGRPMPRPAFMDGVMYLVRSECSGTRRLPSSGCSVRSTPPSEARAAISPSRLVA